jgi:DNA-binding transcriptional LysR family regulator
VVPTQAGRALLPHAWRLLTTADNAFADMTSVLRNSRATVRIGAIPSALPATAQIVARIDEDAQGVNLQADGTSDTLIAELRRGALDMAVCVASLIDEGLVSPRSRTT